VEKTKEGNIMEEIHAEVIEEPEVKANKETEEEKAIRLQLEYNIKTTHLPKSVRRGKTPEEIKKLRNKAYVKKVKDVQKQIDKIEKAKAKKEAQNSLS
jgi:antitoxin component of RelBE/YafQ-DinJ toxin-antitoxin module